MRVILLIGCDDLNKKTLIIITIFILTLLGCTRGEALGTDTLIDEDFNNLRLEDLTEYKIDVELDEKNKSYTGWQYTSFTNTTDVALGEIYFHLYPNAFRSLEEAPIMLTQEFTDPLRYDNGFIDILEVSIGDRKHDLFYEVMGQDNTILKVSLDSKLEVGEKVELFLGYDAKLPNVKERYGYGQRTMNFGNWYPILCVYDEDGWNLEPYYNIGDPFYSDVANYKVSIKTSKDMVVASSGNILTETINDDEKTYQIEGKLIRDFAWAASPDFKLKELKADDTLVKLYYLDEKSTTVRNALNASVDSIRTFNKVFGKYPYGQYTVVISEFPSGMEYPTFVLISNDYFNNASKDILDQVIVHETAHQWWYGLVGNNQVKEAWLDEALTTYSEIIYSKEIYGEEKARDYYQNNISSGFEYGKRYLGNKQVVNRHLKNFDGWNDYSILVYTKGAMFINQIKNNFGEETLYKILNRYYEENKFYNARTEDFIRICEEVTGSSFNDLVDTWLN